MKIKDLFVKKYINCDVTIYPSDIESDERIYFEIKFCYLKNGTKEWWGLFTQKQRENYTKMFNEIKNLKVTNLEVSSDKRNIWVDLV